MPLRRMRRIACLLSTAALAVVLFGCPRAPESATQQDTPAVALPTPAPVGPPSVPTEDKPGIDTDAPGPVTAEDAPQDRASFEKWNVATSPHTPRNDDERAVIAELTRWLVQDAKFKNMVLIPCPNYDRKDLPGEYYKWFEGEELTVYLFRKRGPDEMVVTVGPPEACPLCTATVSRENGKWMVRRAVDDTGPEEVLFYERDKGFIEAEE